MRRDRGGGAGAVDDDQGKPSPVRAGLGPEALTRVATFALWALVVLGAMGGTLAFLTRPTAVAASARPPAQPTDGPAGFAELFVAAYLGAGEGTEDQLAAYYPERVELRGVQAGSLYSARTVTVGVEVVGERYWSVTVAADVLVAEGEGFRRGGTRFFRVAIFQAGNGQPFAATSLPAEVPEPPPAPEVRLDLGSMERPKPDDAVAGALERFFAAYLAGDGELARYIAPGAALRAVLPAPFATTVVTRLATKELGGAARQVLVEVQGTDTGGRLQVLHYSLALSQSVGRWEVTALLPGPPLRARPPPAPAATDPGPTPVPTAEGTTSSTSTPSEAADPADSQPPTTTITERNPG